MKNLLNTSLKVSAVLLIAAALSSCGSNGVTGAKPATTPTYNPTGSSSSSSSGGSYDFYPAYSYSFSTYGAAAQTVSTDLTTDNLLKVRVTADAASRNQGTPVYTNFAAEYTCAQFKVTLQQQVGANWVNVTTKTTAALKVVGTTGCTDTNAKTEEVYDFSSYMTPGHGLMRIRIESYKTDFYCQLFNRCLEQANQNHFWSYDCAWAAQVNMQQYTCQLKTVYQYHTVNGSLEVQTNGTTF